MAEVFFKHLLGQNCLEFLRRILQDSGMSMKNGPYRVLMENPQNERFRRQMNPLSNPNFRVNPASSLSEEPNGGIGRVGWALGGWDVAP